MAKQHYPTWLANEHMSLAYGYIETKNHNGYLAFVSDGNIARKHKRKGFNQLLGQGQRIININTNESGYFYIGIKCDGGTRTLFDGICSTEEEFQQLLTLID